MWRILAEYDQEEEADKEIEIRNWYVVYKSFKLIIVYFTETGEITF